MAVGQVQGAGNSGAVDELEVYSSEPLTAQEKEQLSKQFETQMGLSPELADTMVSRLSPQQARHLIANNGELTKEDAISLYGLTEGEAEMLFGDQKVVGLFSKSFGDIYLFFLTLAAEMEADLSVLYQETIMTVFDSQNKANDQSLAGAVGKFIFGMAAAAMTVGGALVHARGTLGNSKSAWTNLTSPMFLQLFTAIPNSIGEFYQQLHEHAAKKYQNYAEVFEKISGIINDDLGQTRSAERSTEQAISTQ